MLSRVWLRLQASLLQPEQQIVTPGDVLPALQLLTFSCLKHPDCAVYHSTAFESQAESSRHTFKQAGTHVIHPTSTSRYQRAAPSLVQSSHVSQTQSTLLAQTRLSVGTAVASTYSQGPDAIRQQQDLRAFVHTDTRYAKHPKGSASPGGVEHIHNQPINTVRRQPSHILGNPNFEFQAQPNHASTSQQYDPGRSGWEDSPQVVNEALPQPQSIIQRRQQPQPGRPYQPAAKQATDTSNNNQAHKSVAKIRRLFGIGQPSQYNMIKRPPSPPILQELVDPPTRAVVPAAVGQADRESQQRASKLCYKGDVSTIDRSLHALTTQLGAIQEEQRALQAACAAVESCLLSRWPDARVHVYGSAATGLSLQGSNDIDLCLEMPGLADDDRPQVVEEMGRIMADAGMAKILVLPKARTPAVKFKHPPTKVSVDVAVNVMLGVHNSRFLKTYASLDSRLRQLVLLIKHWAKQRDINDSFRGGLSSYALVIMCIMLLASRQPPILPNLLTEAPTTVHVEVGPWQVAYCDELSLFQARGLQNTESLADLFLAFFEHWSFKHDYQHTVASLRGPNMVVSKLSKNWHHVAMDSGGWNLFCIEDPFELSHNLTQTIDRWRLLILRAEFERAVRLLQRKADPLPLLFQPSPTEVS